MARTVAQIEKTLTDAVAQDPVLNTQYTSTSKRAIWRLWCFIVAVAQAFLEQLFDAYQVEIEKKVSQAPPGSAPWVQAKVFEFQYDSVTPQIIQLINLAPVYPVVDPTLRIVTRCSVTTDISNICTVKVAKGEPPTALSGDELTALAGYMGVIGVAGIKYNVISLAADRIFVQADIYYRGIFSSVIKSNVILAINNYLAGIPFNGRVKLSDIELAIKAVTGVEDVVFKNVVARDNATAFGGGTPLVSGSATASRYWPTVAGYAISEDTNGSTLADSLNFISE